MRLSVGAEYDLAPQCKLGARLTASRLRGDARNSPITVDARPQSAPLFGSYRF